MQYNMKNLLVSKEHCEKALKLDPEFKEALILQKELLKIE